MSDLNSICISGRITKDCVLKNNVAFFSIANSSAAKDEKGEWGEKPMFFNVSYYSVALAPYLTKGVHVTITGKLKQSVWEKDGQQRDSISISAKEVFFSPSNKRPSKENNNSNHSSSDDKIPF